MRLHNKDSDSFARFMTDRLSESYEFDTMEQELDNDFRIEKPSGDVAFRYNDFQEFSKSNIYHNNLLAQSLLSENISISSDQLTSTLQNKYGLSSQECKDTLRSLANTKNIAIHQNKFTKEISIKKI